jgi:hypothetical protein
MKKRLTDLVESRVHGLHGAEHRISKVGSSKCNAKQKAETDLKKADDRSEKKLRDLACLMSVLPSHNHWISVASGETSSRMGKSRFEQLKKSEQRMAIAMFHSRMNCDVLWAVVMKQRCERSQKLRG